MIKFENLNLFDALRQIVDRNTKHYKTDLEYDIEAIQKNTGCDIWWWMSRECGTQIDRECDILCDGRPSSLKHFMDESYLPLIYVIDIKSRGEHIIADLYSLSLCEAKEWIDKYSVRSHALYHYANGCVLNEIERNKLTVYEQCEIGCLQKISYFPDNTPLFIINVMKVLSERDKSVKGDFKRHLNELSLSN